VATRLADLGVGELAAGQGLGDEGQGAEGAGDADVLAGGAGGEADTPGEPGGTGGEAVGPAALGVEDADEVEEARDGGIEVGRQLGDLIAHVFEVRRGHLHGESPFCAGRLYTVDFRRLGGLQEARSSVGPALPCRS
jgi:hypothetical protein